VIRKIETKNTTHLEGFSRGPFRKAIRVGEIKNKNYGNH
jgi:hypothetical protein